MMYIILAQTSVHEATNLLTQEASNESANERELHFDHQREQCAMSHCNGSTDNSMSLLNRSLILKNFAKTLLAKEGLSLSLFQKLDSFFSVSLYEDG